MKKLINLLQQSHNITVSFPFLFFLPSRSLSFFLSLKPEHHFSLTLVPVTPATCSVHLERPYHHRNHPQLSRNPAIISGEGFGRTAPYLQRDRERSDDHSDHYKPLFPIPRRPEESPRSPLHDGVNRYAILHFRKIAILLFIFFVLYPVTVCEQ